MTSYGVVTAHVKQVSDPQGEGRVKLAYRNLEGNLESAWAPVATLMSGGGRGSWFMPEEGDEVLVAFAHGDVNHPYVLGFLWNGEDSPPSTDGPSVRRIRTKSGHLIEFDDRAGSEKIHIQSHGGHELTLDDGPTSRVTVRTTGDLSIQLSDAPPAITIDGPQATLSVTCLEASVNASAVANLTTIVLNVSAALTRFKGAIQAGMVITDAVVGSAYTPGPGNTFGL